MKKLNKCKICGKKKVLTTITTRDKTKANLIDCGECECAFLSGNSFNNISKNKLNHSRLNYKSLSQVSLKKEFQNNYIESEKKYKKFLNKSLIGKNILEIGPSWGAFLSLAKKMKAKPYGLEIDKKKSKFINTKLNIKCFENFKFLEKNKIKFKRIYLFYVIEYFYNPEKELKRILNLLDNDGKIVIITPNYNDVLKNVWKDRNYLNFFYEKNAKNYFSIKSLKKLLKNIDIRKFQITCKQGYSIFNNINWLFNGLPTKSNYVGSDDLINEFNQKMLETFRFERNKVKHIVNLLKEVDRNYKEICERKKFGNQIQLIIHKN
jgi:2-polyprenyl-3-methyl-5-hydroxy-6-metoxy-1,4-benzoquinol methylase